MEEGGMASEMIERVAKALFLWQHGHDHWDDAAPEERDDAREAGRAAIEAMREPTPEMTSGEGIQTNCHMCGGHTEGWRLMIDTALADPLPIHDRLTNETLGSREVED
jgi:hypothetical protein